MRVGLEDNIGTIERRKQLDDGRFKEPWEELHPEDADDPYLNLAVYSLFVLLAWANSGGISRPIPTQQHYDAAGIVFGVGSGTGVWAAGVLAVGLFASGVWSSIGGGTIDVTEANDYLAAHGEGATTVEDLQALVDAA